MKKSAFIILLTALILSTSSFLIIESSKYYQKFYEGGVSQGVFLAVLLESFVIVLAMSKVYRLPLRIVQKGLMLSVFTIIVATASLFHVAPILESISQSKNQDKITSIIKDEIANLKQDSTVFDKQKQKRNSAIAANRRFSVFKSLLSTVNDATHVSVAAYLNIAVLVLIRLLLQCCNLFCASMLGTYYRKPILKLRKIISKDYG